MQHLQLKYNTKQFEINANVYPLKPLIRTTDVHNVSKSP